MEKKFVVGGAVLVAVLVTWVVLTKLPALTIPSAEVDDTLATTTNDLTPSLASSTEEEMATTSTSEVASEPGLRSLDMKSWEWVSATYADGRIVTPHAKGDFVMTFGAGGGVSFDTDCNSMSSSYEAYTGGLTFAPIASTKMYCEGSKETEFATLITDTKTYHFTTKGELILETGEGATVVFR